MSMKQNVKIGLALGSGASRGLAHIGVLQVLEEHNIIPSFITGSSIGAVIGALYASGISPKIMEGIARQINTKRYFDVTVPRHGFIQGKRIEDLLKLLTQNKDFDALKIPLAVTATDLRECQLVVFREGKVYRAVRASISIPGIFVPVEINDQVLVDGGVLERVPVKIAKDMGADIIIGVDVGFRGIHEKPNNILEVFMQSLEVMGLAMADNSESYGDIMIYPDLHNINPMIFEQVDECIDEGRRATLNAINKIKDLTEKLNAI